MKYKKFVNFEYFARIIKIYLIALLNYFLFFILLIIRPFKKIKIFELETRAIGHYSLSIEIFLSEIESPTTKLFFKLKDHSSLSSFIIKFPGLRY